MQAIIQQLNIDLTVKLFSERQVGVLFAFRPRGLIFSEVFLRPGDPTGNYVNLVHLLTRLGYKVVQGRDKSHDETTERTTGQTRVSVHDTNNEATFRNDF